MRRLLPLLLLSAPLLAADPPKGTSYAFLVAAAEYDKNELRPLPYSGKETAEFRDVLIASGYDAKNVKLLHDKAERRYLPTRKQIAEELDILIGRATADDTVVVLLNGHGVHFSGDNTGYFCPVDAKLSDKTTLLPMEGKGGVFELLKGCRAKRKVLLVNACRNDPRSDLSLAGDKIKLDDDDQDEVPEGIAALYSCKPGERSYYYDPTDAKSKGRERSLYMHHLIEAWGQGGKTTIEDVFKRVREGASADADTLFARKQNPVVRREISGQGEWLVAGEAEGERLRPPQRTSVRPLRQRRDRPRDRNAGRVHDQAVRGLRGRSAERQGDGRAAQTRQVSERCDPQPGRNEGAHHIRWHVGGGVGRQDGREIGYT
jgi:hypothetical protein